MHELLEGFPVVIEQVVDWGDMDAYQHVNNVVYFRYFENARIEYMRRLDWFSFEEETGIGPIVATTQARFRRAVTYPDILHVGVRISAMGDDRFTMDYRIASTQQNSVVTLGDCVVVTYHYAESRKVPVPARLRERIAALEGNQA